MAEPNSLDEFLAARRKDLISCANEREIDWQSKLGMRVLVACEPRYYREVIGETIRGLRPAVEVVIVDPDELADGVSHLDPDLVISAHPPSLDPGGRSAWVEFAPYEKPAATVSIGGATPGTRRANVGGSALGGRSGR